MANVSPVLSTLIFMTALAIMGYGLFKNPLRIAIAIGVVYVALTVALLIHSQFR